MILTSQLTHQLKFREISSDDFSLIAQYMSLTNSLTCDYTLGGIVLWDKYFGYRMAMADDTMFILGGREDNLAIPAFALPLGTSDLHASLSLLSDYCGRRGWPLWFSAIPEDRLHLFADRDVEIVELGPQWSDYLYDIRQFASLSGGVMKKKRNHLNHFLGEHPDTSLLDLSPAYVPDCLALLQTVGHDDTPTGRAEYDAVSAMLSDWSNYSPYFIGMVLTANNHVVGFSVGEIKGETLHVHIEKSLHEELSGVNEVLASMFAASVSERWPRLRYLNRQDDAGDPGLRASKQSWHPLRLLPKFNVHL